MTLTSDRQSRWQQQRPPSGEVTRLRGQRSGVIYKRVETEPTKWYPLSGGQTRAFHDLLRLEGALDDVTPDGAEPTRFGGDVKAMRQVTAAEILGQVGPVNSSASPALHRLGAKVARDVIPTVVELLEAYGYVVAEPVEGAQVPSTVGTTFNGNQIIAAMRHADDPTKLAIAVHIEKRLRKEYGVGVVRVDADGQPTDNEWDNGSYHARLEWALVKMAERAKQVRVGDLGLTPQAQVS